MPTEHWGFCKQAVVAAWVAIWFAVILIANSGEAFRIAGSALWIAAVVLQYGIGVCRLVRRRPLST